GRQPGRLGGLDGQRVPGHLGPASRRRGADRRLRRLGRAPRPAGPGPVAGPAARARAVHGAVRAGLGGHLGRGVPAAGVRPVRAGPQRAGGRPGHGAAGTDHRAVHRPGPALADRAHGAVTVLAGFAVLALATLGLLLIAAATPLWLIAAILAGRSVAIGLVITPLLQALVQPLRPDQLGDANTLFNTWQRIAGSFGIGLVAALYATRARTLGPVAALHTAGLVLAAIAVAGALGALALPAVRNTATRRT